MNKTVLNVTRFGVVHATVFCKKMKKFNSLIKFLHNFLFQICWCLRKKPRESKEL